tara:strand:- start:1238 stop:1900 length:663 start_codon:yes stop_codon:yes gene_type:complete
MLEYGARRVFYLDLDAHHGDGVQDAFAYDDRVFTLSIHEDRRWPMARDGSSAGNVLDRAGGKARNIPVPPGFNDTELDFLTTTVVLPLISDFVPDVIYIQCGADALADDPQSKLTVSNLAIWQTVAAVATEVPKLLVAGGGGYNPYAVGRCWSGIWAIMNGISIPEKLPKEVESCLRAVKWDHRLARNAPEHWFTTLADPPRNGLVRKIIKELAEAVLEL